MNKLRMLFVFLALTILSSIVQAGTVVVYPTYTNINIGSIQDSLNSKSTYIDYSDGNIYTLSVSDNTLYVKRTDTKTGATESHMVDAMNDIAPLGGVVVNDGYVTIGYTQISTDILRPENQTQDGYFKIYTEDFQPVSGRITCTVEQSITNYNTSEVPGDIYVVCGKNVQRNGLGDVLFVRVYPYNDSGDEKYLVVVGVTLYNYVAPDWYSNFYSGIGVLNSPDGKVVIKASLKAGGMNQTDIPVTGLIAKGKTPSTIMYGMIEIHWSDQSKYYYTMVGPASSFSVTDPVEGLTYTNYDVTTLSSTDRHPIDDTIASDSTMVNYNGKDLLILYREDGNIVLFDGQNVYKNLTSELNSIGLTPLTGNLLNNSDNVPNRYSLVVNDDILLIEAPVIDVNNGNKTEIVLLGYNPYDGKLRKLRVLSDYDTEKIDGSLYGKGQDLVLVGRDDTGSVSLKYKAFKEMWIIADPPYLQEPPGSTFNAVLKTTVSADLVDINAPQFMTVNLPSHIDPPQVTITISISQDAPEDNYGIIRFTYAHTGDDGINDTFESGIIYKTTNANDPPTTPEINNITADNGIITVTWLPSTDPDGDQITYIVDVYDETTDVNVVSGATTAETTYSFPGEVGHLYSISVTATDGNLYSNTDTKEFLYEWKTELRIIDPPSGAYSNQSLLARVYYYTNAQATLELQMSTDGTNWNTVSSATVSGEGMYETNITLGEGTNYLVAVLILGSDTRQSDVVTLTFSPDINYTMVITEPVDGSEYQTKPGTSVSVPFTAYYEVNYAGTRTYSIIVTGDKNGMYTVASVSTDENRYTLTGQYGLGKGDYMAYPSVTTDLGTVYGNPVRFTVIETNTPNNPPSKPILYDMPNTTEINVTLRWHASTDPDGDPITYNVVVARDELFQDVVFTGHTTQTSLEVNNLYGGNVYYWRVQACDDKGLCSAWSDPDSFAVFESTGTEIVYPTESSSFVADETNNLNLTIEVHSLSNTNRSFRLDVYVGSNVVFEKNYDAPFDETTNIPVTLTPGTYTIRSVLTDLDTNETFSYEVNITVFAYGQEQAPQINLIDPQDGYIDTVTDLNPKTTITARASFDLVKDGNHTIAIQYKLRWSRTWTTVVENTVTADLNANKTHFNLTTNVELGEGIYYFRAVVVDPDGITWTSETHTVYIQKQTTTQPGEGEGGEQGGGGGGGGGAAPILTPEKVVWEVPAGQESIQKIELNNVSTNPIKVKIEYEGEIAKYIVAPPEDSPIIITPGKFELLIRVNAKGLEPGTVITGKIILLPTGTSIEIPVKMHVVSGVSEEVAGEIAKKIAVPIMIGVGLLIAYLLLRGVV